MNNQIMMVDSIMNPSGQSSIIKEQPEYQTVDSVPQTPQSMQSVIKP